MISILKELNSFYNWQNKIKPKNTLKKFFKLNNLLKQNIYKYSYKNISKVLKNPIPFQKVYFSIFSDLAISKGVKFLCRHKNKHPVTYLKKDKMITLWVKYQKTFYKRIVIFYNMW